MNGWRCCSSARYLDVGQRLSRTRGFVKIQDGCHCHCAYCVIPTVRGAARSRPATAVLDEVRRVSQGQPEMVITGISVGDYRDPERGLELGPLLVEIVKVPAGAVIVGFPTEDERFGDRVAPEEKKRRSQAVRGRSEVRSRHHRAGKLGTVERVLVDKLAEGQCSGYTADYTRCYLPAGVAARGELIDVECAELHADGIRCRIPRTAALSWNA